MPNTFFRFRQFTVHQQHAAMKVCTDACIFGAWVANRIKGEKPNHILDIGTGTGLLSLMLAQESSADIDAVEVDSDACEEASANFNDSPWSGRLKVHCTPVQSFFSAYPYDVIVANPPFYENDLRSPDEKRNKALHGTHLGYGELISNMKRLLAPGGKAFVLIPSEKSKRFEALTEEQAVHVEEKMMIRQTEKHRFFRSIYMLTQNTVINETAISELTIRDAANQYTPEFNMLLKEYYL
jgi:tRNA1Val (adenine37-N6)-methyltransferase